jgi:hypothetical protein
LARIDGKSPVEYITGERDKAFVRTLAKEFLNDRCKTLDGMLARTVQTVSQANAGSMSVSSKSPPT